MRKMPWVRFFPSDWLGGTRGMSAVETGIYITLIATMYERGEPIQEDHSRLARLCGASNSAFKKALEILVDEGKISRVDGGLWNDRVEKEQVYLSEKSEVGSRAANVRWSKKDNKNNGGGDTDALPAQSQGNANQKPDTRTISSSLRSEDARAPVAPTPRSELLACLDADHAQAVIDHRRRIGKSLTAHAAKLLAGKFGRCPDPNSAADAMVANGWQGFEPEWLENRAMPRGQSPPQVGADGLPRDAQGRVSMADYTSQILRKMEQQGHDGRTIEGSYERRDGDGTEPSFPLLGA
ncbi:MAG: YdaU family protein [Rhizobium sp.]|nr:YdaU family protein [Rhizobium sp.]MBW8321148.1 YdaU family protein [Rhizobium sp.]MBW8447902.1 YdaU family protein [Arenimonas sp.]